MTRILHTALLAVGWCAALIAGAQAQDFPKGPITIVVPYVAGGPADQSARVTGDMLSKELGVPVVIENKPGAATTVATEYVSRSAPDGQTLLLAASSTFTTNPFLYKNLSYDIDDFEVVAMLSKVPFVVHIAKRIPAKNVAEFVAWAKAKPEGVTSGTVGVGSTAHIMSLLLSKQLGINVTPVPYKGSAAASTDLIAGVIDMQLDGINSGKTNHEAGNTQLIGLLDTERWPDMPDIATFREQGFPDAIFYSWNALLAPPGTPEDVVAKLHVAVNKVLAEQEVQDKFKVSGQVPYVMTPEEIAAFIAKEQETWGGVIEQEGITIEQ